MKHPKHEVKSTERALYKIGIKGPFFLLFFSLISNTIAITRIYQGKHISNQYTIIFVLCWKYFKYGAIEKNVNGKNSEINRWKQTYLSNSRDYFCLVAVNTVFCISIKISVGLCDWFFFVHDRNIGWKYSQSPLAIRNRMHSTCHFWEESTTPPPSWTWLRTWSHSTFLILKVKLS